MRQLILNTLPEPDGTIRLSGKDYRYLIQVLRKEKGDTVDARFPDGSLKRMVISEITGKTVMLSDVQETAPTLAADNSGILLTRERSSGTAGGVSATEVEHDARTIPLWLFQWLPKGQKLDQIIRQAAETGISGVIPVIGEYSPKTDSENALKAERRERIVREARQQSGSPVDTKIYAPCTLSEALNIWYTVRGSNYRGLVLTEAPLARKPLHGYLIEKPATIALAVGPEGGMSGTELETLYQSGFCPVHFNTCVLRTETAALYGIAAVQTVITEYDSWHGSE